MCIGNLVLIPLLALDENGATKSRKGGSHRVIALALVLRWGGGAALSRLEVGRVGKFGAPEVISGWLRYRHPGLLRLGAEAPRVLNT